MARKQSKSPSPGSPQRPDSNRPPADPVIEEKPPRHAVPPFPVVGIGASAGGLEAAKLLLRALPADTGMAFVLIQHLDPTHSSMLTEILSRETTMPVAEVADHTAVEPNRVYVIPPGTNMVIEQSILRLSPRSETRGLHRAVDHFFRSLAEDQGHKAIGVILSGSASDGTLGLESIKADGGITFAQDDTAQHKSMPRSAIAAGCVDFVLPPDEIAREIARISRHPYVAPGAEPAVEGAAHEPKLNEVLDQLRFVTGVDFSNYKRNTLYRRITRRLVLHKLEGLGEYVRFLKSNPAEVQLLYQDVLISVTSFFRNEEAFEVLKSKVFPRLTQDRSRHEPMRIWVLGCSTGEEAYSIAIAFAEFAEASGRHVPLQLFATDLNGVAVERARAGIYSKTITQDVSPDRLRRFFVEIDGSYRITKSIRDACVFARHDVLSEPPFSRIDLISCRNLLIYLEPSLQQRVLTILHYALKPKGALWLGSSETIGTYRDLFEVDDNRQKFYSKRPGAPRAAVSLIPTPRGKEPHALSQPRREILAPGLDVQKEADRLLLTRYAPASVLINADLEIVQFRGDTGRYLAPSPGRASFNLLKMVREGLMVGVRGAVSKAKREEMPVREEGLGFNANGGHRVVDVQVIPVRDNSGPEQYFLVLFEEATPAAERRGKQPRLKMAKARAAGRRERESAEREVAQLRHELAATREYLQSVVEQQEAANEELQSSNEEVQSANEELQSINEELETSKEEIQSSNEELATVNDELHNRNLELSQSNNDFINLLASAQLPLVMLGSDLRIRRFTPMAELLFNLIPADMGRPVTDIKLNVDIPDLEPMLAEVIETVSVKEREVRDKQGHWYLLRIRPYRTLENKLDGAVLVLVDVDTLKQSQETLHRQAELLDQGHEAIVMWELDGGIIYWNRGAEEAYGYTREQALGRKPHELLATSPPYSVFKEALVKEGHWKAELVQTRRDGEKVVVESRMVLERSAGPQRLVLETDHLVTERKRMEEALRDRAEALAAADRRKNEFLAMLAHELRNPLAPIANAVQIMKEPGASAEIVTRARDIMDRQIQAMTRMIDDLLDVTHLTRGQIQLRLRPVKVATLVAHAVELNEHQIQGRGQHLSISLPPDEPVVQGDEVRLSQVLSNLLNNASKFTPKAGHIWLTAERSGGDGSGPSEVTIRVRDDGIGMNPEVVPRVFDLFMQADQSLGRRQGGLGIGLTVVRRLVELHDGSVAASSPGPGQGSEFLVRLPITSDTAARVSHKAPPEEAASRKAAPRRILVVDDNVDMAASLGIVLRLEGHEVEVAHDGPAALNLAATFRPEVVFLDIGMAGMDGYETARRLRQLPGLEKVLLVAITGYSQQDARRRAKEAGFDHYLTKPVQQDTVSQLLAPNQSSS
jgi:two-component system CheB/CheR fusion protein